MGKRKNGQIESLESLLARPWCYYCDRDFDDVNVLVGHQKQKHFQCTMPTCHRKLNTAGGLRVHLSQVHKEELPEVPNALEGRRDPNIEIFAMEGVPADLIETRTAYVTREYKKLEAEHYQKTGNPLPGTGGHQSAKRPKLESKEEMLARAKAHAAKRKAEKAAAAAGGSVPSNGTNSAGDTPNAYPQATPTPPGNTGFSVPPPLGPIPGYPQVPVAASGSPIPPNMPPAWNQPPGPQGEYWRNHPLPTASASSPPLPFVHPTSSIEISPGVFRMSPNQAWLPPQQPPMPHAEAPSLRASIDAKGLPAGLPSRPLPPGQLPSRPNIPAKPGNTSFSQDDLENLFDEAQANVARATAAEQMKQGSNTAIATGQAEPDTAETPVRAEDAVPRDAAHKDTKKQKAAAAPSGPAVGSRTNHLLHNDVDSFEELKALRYRIDLQPTTIATEMATQGATGPVEEGADDVEMS